jgi:hypothetical protein
VVVLLLPLSLAMDDGEFNHSGGGGGSGGPVVAAVAVVAAVGNRDQWQWRLMTAATLGGGHATTSWCSKRAAQQENKRLAQGEAMQQPANLLPRRHFDMQHCHLLRCHGVSRHHCLQRCHSNMRHCLWPRGDSYGKE